MRPGNIGPARKVRLLAQVQVEGAHGVLSGQAKARLLARQVCLQGMRPRLRREPRGSVVAG